MLRVASLPQGFLLTEAHRQNFCTQHPRTSHEQSTQICPQYPLFHMLNVPPASLHWRSPALAAHARQCNHPGSWSMQLQVFAVNVSLKPFIAIGATRLATLETTLLPVYVLQRFHFVRQVLVQKEMQRGQGGLHYKDVCNQCLRRTLL